MGKTIKYKILNIYICACDYNYVLRKVARSIKYKRSLLISPLASQTLVKAWFNKHLQNLLNQFDELYPDSQWVKRTIWFLYGVYIKERIYGPELMLRICKLGVKNRYRIFLYGTTEDTLKRLTDKLKIKFPGIKIVGSSLSKFRDLDGQEKKELISKIKSKEPDILLISLGSPREQIFAHNLVYKRPKLSIPLIVIPFGAAFDFISDVKSQASKRLQDAGLEWFYRLATEPRRLYKRYLILGPLYVILVLYQKMCMLFNLTDDVVIKSKIRR